VEDCDKPGGAVKQALIPVIPELAYAEFIGVRSERGELKHLSTPRKRKQKRLRQ
jgi:hypothetical protein